MISTFLILKLSPCSECYILSFGWFRGIWILYADVSEQSVPSSYVLCAFIICEDETDSVPKRRGIIQIKNTTIFIFFIGCATYTEKCLKWKLGIFCVICWCIRLRWAGIDKHYKNSVLASSRSVCMVYLGMSLVPQWAERHTWDICVFRGTLELDK
jgi:hypothetical protein